MRAAALVAAAMFACGGDAPDDVCLLLGCLEVATIEVLTVVDAATLADTTIEACRNDDCVRGAVPAPSEPYDNTTRLGGAVSARLVLLPVDGGYQLVATIEQVADTAADGDRYTVTVRRADGTVVVDDAWTATYSDSFPNGPDCDRCVHAALTPVP